MGTLYWITGLSGAGKTTIATALFKLLRSKKDNVIFLDGDKLREIFGIEAAYSLEERRNLALQYSRLCKSLTDQGVDVICATISMFHECREWNKSNIKNYNEIYLKVSLDILKSRDPKKIYSRYAKGEVKQVMGLDIPFEEPLEPDMVINNDGNEKPEMLAKEIIKHIYQESDASLDLVA